MRALGKGSIASIIRIGLTMAWYFLWLLAVGLIVGAICYGAMLAMVQGGFQEPAWFGELVAPTKENPAGFIWPVAAPTFLIGAVSIGGGLIIIDRLRKLFDGFSSGEPFRKDNATHLRMIWVSMLIVEVSRMGLMMVMGALLAVFGPARGVGVKEISPNTDLTTWVSILILIVLAEVFREGARMKEEQELTI